MKTLFQELRILMVIAPLLILLSCKARDTERSSLWSTQTAAAFGNLVKNGRAIAPKDSGDGNGNTLALAAGAENILFNGIKPIHIELDSSSDVVIHAWFDTTRSITFSKTANLAVEAQSLLFANAKTLGLEPTELVPNNNIVANSGQWQTIIFRRNISGIHVRDARIDLIFAGNSNQWQLAEIVNRGWGKTPEAGATQKNLLTPGQLASVTGVSDLKIVASGVQYVPRKNSSNKQTILNRANWYEIQGAGDAHYTLTFSGAESPQLIEAFSHRTDMVLVGSAFERSWNTGKVNVPLADATVISANGTKQVLDGQGSSTNGDLSGKVTTASTWATVRTSNGIVPQFPIVTQNGQSTVEASGNNAPELNTYLTLARIRQYVRQFLNDSETGYFRRKLTVTTQVQGTCNAYYQNTTLSFFAEGDSCADMATVNDVIMHEWGHGLDDYTGNGSENGGGMEDSSFSEGIGDINAMMYSGDNKMGAGFFTSNPTKPLRNLDNKLVYQQGYENEMHVQGTIIGGAFWELRRRMINKYGTSVGAQKAASLFYKHLTEADSYLASYDIVQRLADNDGNPATKSPDFCVINHAFAQKGLANRDACTDDFDNGGSQQPNSDVVVAIVGENGGGAMFEAATSNSSATTIDLCRGQDCTNVELSLKPSEVRVDRRIFNNAGASLPLTSGVTTIRIMAKDGSGKILESVHARIRSN